MAKAKNKYLFRFPFNIYNNEKPLYQITPLPNSDLEEVYIFAVRKQLTPTLYDRETFLYIETKVPISDVNRYKNLIILTYLIELATGLPTNPEPIDISNFKSFNDLYEKLKAELFHDEFSYGGLVNDKNPIERVVVYSRYLNTLSEKDLRKFENSLQTYIWGQEISRLPNPHLRYTLFMTLFLSSINQLADNPHPICPTLPICPDCGKTLDRKHSTSHGYEMEKLVKSLLTGDEVEQTARKVKKLYNDLRSNFLHEGLLSGGEREGGFFSTTTPSIQLVEDMANIQVLNRKLIELFLQQKAIKTHS